MIRRHPESAAHVGEFAYDSAWRNSVWDVEPLAAAVGNGTLECSQHACLRALALGDAVGFDSALTAMHVRLVDAVSVASTEVYARVGWPGAVRVHRS